MNEQDFLNAHNAIESAKRIAVAGHVSPDGDCYGSVLGLGQALEAAGKQVDMIADEKLPHYTYIPGYEKLQSVDEDKKYDLCIRVDLGDTPRMGRAGKLLQNSATSLNFDHHLQNDNACDINVLDPKASSTCEIIALFLQEMDYPMPPEAATALFAGLTTDSNRYLYDTATTRTLRVAAKLLESGADKKDVYFHEYQSEDPKMIVFSGDVVKHAEFFHDGQLVMANLSKALLKEYGISMSEAEGVVDTLRSLRGVEIAVIVKEEEADVQKLSFRSKRYFNVSDLAVQFGGGGHLKASGATVTGEDHKSVCEKVREVLRNLDLSE